MSNKNYQIGETSTLVSIEGSDLNGDSIMMETSSKYDFVILANKTCLFFAFITNLLKEKIEQSTNNLELKRLSKIKIFPTSKNEIKSISLSSCECYIAVNCSKEILFYSIYSISQGVSLP